MCVSYLKQEEYLNEEYPKTFYTTENGVPIHS